MGMKTIITAALSAAALALSSGVFAEGRLETPADGSGISGKALFSGWHCDASSIEIELPSGTLLPAATGTVRGDLNSRCGKTDVGFGLLFNMAELGEGEQTNNRAELLAVVLVIESLTIMTKNYITTS